MKVTLVIVAISLSISAGPAEAKPYIPQSDAEILEILPVKSSEKQRLKESRNELNNRPEDYTLALKLAREYIGVGRTQSDPRYYGYAEAVLAPWLKPPHAKAGALVLQAAILQNRHDFQAALSLLNSALNLDPRHPQAWLTQAAIHEVQGNYPQALQSCLALAKYGNASTANICINSALSLSGQAQPAYRQLTATVGSQGDPEELTWAYTLLAELAERLALNPGSRELVPESLGPKLPQRVSAHQLCGFLIGSKPSRRGY